MSLDPVQLGKTVVAADVSRWQWTEQFQTRPHHDQSKPDARRLGLTSAATQTKVRSAGVALFLFGLAMATQTVAADSIATTNQTWWSFHPIHRPLVPTVPTSHLPPRTSIDSFITAKLAEKGLTPNPPATRRELIRRATFDLLGLPPNFEEPRMVNELEKARRV